MSAVITSCLPFGAIGDSIYREHGPHTTCALIGMSCLRYQRVVATRTGNRIFTSSCLSHSTFLMSTIWLHSAVIRCGGPVKRTMQSGHSGGSQGKDELIAASLPTRYMYVHSLV